jgi:hypothetical protein
MIDSLLTTHKCLFSKTVGGFETVGEITSECNVAFRGWLRARKRARPPAAVQTWTCLEPRGLRSGPALGRPDRQEH